MECKNYMSFSGTILLPEGIDTVIDDLNESAMLTDDPINALVAVNTEHLNITSELVEKEVDVAAGGICEGKELKAKALVYEIRISGYLVYSIGAEVLKSSANFDIVSELTDDNFDSVDSVEKDYVQVRNVGCASLVDILALSAENENGVKLPYLIVGVSKEDPKDYEIEVSLVDLDIYPVINGECKHLAVSGEFVFTAKK